MCIWRLYVLGDHGAASSEPINLDRMDMVLTQCATLRHKTEQIAQIVWCPCSNHRLSRTLCLLSVEALV